MIGNVANTNHGPTLRFMGYDNGGSTGTFRHWVIGTASQNAAFLDIGFATDQSNPHAGIAGYEGVTLIRATNSGNVGIGGDWGTYGSNGNPSYPLHVIGAGYFTGSITVSANNATGGGIILADDGDIVDLNDGYLAMRFSNGVRIYSANRGGSAVITLGNNGVVSASNIFGQSQSMTNVTSSRGLGGTYTNSTGRPIVVYVTMYGVFQLNVVIAGVAAGLNGNSTGYNNMVSFIVPDGSTYSVSTASGSPTLQVWYELR
jgi:hypothetical protein